MLENRKERTCTFNENSYAMLNVPGCRPVNRKHTHTCKHTHIYKLQLKATFLRKILVRITKEEIEWIYLGKMSRTVVIMVTFKTCFSDCQSRFNAWDRVSGLVHWDDTEGWSGWEGGSGWGTHVHPWLIHVNVWQNHYNIVK